MNGDFHPHRRFRLILAIIVLVAISIAVLLRARFMNLEGSVTTVTPVNGPPRTVIAETLSHGQKVVIPANAAGIITCPTTEPPLGSSWRNFWGLEHSYSDGWLYIYQYSQGSVQERDRLLETNARWPGQQFIQRYGSGHLIRAGGDMNTVSAGKTYYVASSQDVAFSCSTPRPIAWWKMEEGQGLTAVDSVSNHNGTLINGPVWIAPGPTLDSSAALQFDGDNDYVQAANSATLNFDMDDRFSFSFLANGQNAVLRNFSLGAAPLRGYLLNIVNGYVQLILSEGPNAGIIASSSIPVSDGRFTHVIVSYDGTQTNPQQRIRMYIGGVYDDGLQTQVFGTPTTFAIPDADFNIGRGFAILSDFPFQGSLDDVRVYDTLIDPSDIPYTFRGSSSSSTTIFPLPPLTVTQSGPSSVSIGTAATYTYRIRNIGTQPVQNVSLRNAIPRGTFVNLPLNDEHCGIFNETLVCDTDPTVTLQPGQEITRSVSFFVNNAPCPNILTNGGFVTALGYRALPTPSVFTSISCAASSSSAVSSSSSVSSGPAFSLVQSGPTSVTAGGSIQYSFNVTNTSTINASNIAVRIPLPPNTAFNVAGSTGSCSAQGTNVLCNTLLPPLPPGGSFSFTILLDIAQGTPCPGSLTSSAFVSANGVSEIPGNVVVTGLTCPVASSSSSVSSASSQASSIFTFEPATAACEPSEWMEAGSDALPRALVDLSAVSHNGKLVAMAGDANISSWGSGVYVSPNGATWTRAGYLPFKLRSGIALSYANKLWYIGGQTSYSNAAPNESFPFILNGASKAVFSSSDDGATWQRVGDLPDFITHSAGVVYNGKMWVLGGLIGQTGFVVGAGIKTPKVYSSTDGITWTQEATMPVPLDPLGFDQYRGLSDHAVTVLNGKMYVVGGYLGGAFQTIPSRDVYVFEPVTGWTRYQGVLPLDFVEHQLVTFQGRLWALGGGTNSIPLCTNYVSENGIDWFLAGNNLPYPATQFAVVVHPFGDRSALWSIGGQATGSQTTPYRKVLVLPDNSAPIILPTLTCGNGTLDQGEECDDSNRVDGDGCFANCSTMAPPYPLP